MVQEDPTPDELASDPAMLMEPGRKTNAKTTTIAKNETAAPKTRSLRGKKRDIQEEAVEEEAVEVTKPASKTKKTTGRAKKDNHADETEAEIAVAQPAKATRAKAAASVRGRKITASGDDELGAEPAKATKSTRSGTLRGKKAAPARDTELDAAIAVEEPKPAQSTKTGSVRGRKAKATVEEPPALPALEPKQTRGTRVTAAKAQPLSPKKITQVSKAATRATKDVDQKPRAKAASAKAPVKGKGITKKRTVSDENAEVPEIQVDVQGEDDAIPELGAAVKTRTSRAKTAEEEVEARSEASMCSQPSTPNDSTVHTIETDEANQDENMEGLEFDAEDEDTKSEDPISEDELCGPKTPMKRASPGAEARYLSSVQRTIRKFEKGERIQTPARRFHVLGSQRGTPQTQKPYCKPIPPSSETRPMTVSRGAGRAFVFRDLREGAPSIPEREIEAENEADLSFVPDDNIIPFEMDTEPDETPVPLIETSSGPSSGPIQLQSPPESDAEVDHTQESIDTAMSYDIEEEGFVVPADIEQDPDETILTENSEDVDLSLTPQPAQSFDTDDTVIITRRAQPPEQETEHDRTLGVDIGDESAVVVHHLKSPRQTVDAIDWQPKHRDATITVNFDDLFSGARSSVEHHEADEVEAQQELLPALEEDEDTVAGAEMDFDLGHMAIEPPSRRQTLNFNEFIDVAALAEPTQALNLDTDTSVEQDQEVRNDDALALAGTVPEVHNHGMDVEQSHPSEDKATEDCNGDEAIIVVEETLPNYARPTIAFDARRKSLPALSHQTPVKSITRPNTSDGASMPRIANPLSNAWWSRSRAASTVNTPIKLRPAPVTPIASNAVMEKTPVATPRERFPRLAPRQDYEAHAQTAAAPKRFQTPNEKPAKRRETFHRFAAGRIMTSDPNETQAPASTTNVAPETPVTGESPLTTPVERYPRLRPRSDYEKHAKTVAAPVRFQTPVKTQVKRPATTQKPESLRKAALKANTPMASRSPTKTPLKAAAMTPSQEPLTPHPAAPLRGVVALVEVFTLEGASASAPFIALLHRLGAKTTRGWSDRVTHVIFKDGSPTTLQRVRLHNKDVEEGAERFAIHCVNSRWVSDCDTAGARMDETDEAYVVDVGEIPRGGKRRRKSMEPSALMNLGGNVVRDRKSSSRTPSFGRPPLKHLAESSAEAEVDTPVKNVDVAEKENSGDDASSPVTPAWLSAPDQLVQQTAPMNRIRKLDLPGKQESKSRRLTFWNGGN